MKRWVYRRPFIRTVKPKIPLHRPGVPARIRRRILILRRRFQRARRRPIITGVAAAATFGKVFQRRIGRQVKVTRYVHRRPTPPTLKFTPPTPGFGMPVIVQQAIAKIRRAFRFRARWKPASRFEPTAPQTPVISYPRGQIDLAGAVEATIYSAGAKRGVIDG